jgi:hypothetical protein
VIKLGENIYRKNGFSAIETLIAIIIVFLVGIIGWHVHASHKTAAPLKTTNTVVRSYKTVAILPTSSDGPSIINAFQQYINDNFHHIDSFVCNGLGATCGSLSPNLISTAENVGQLPARKISGYNFYVMPYQNASSTNAVLNAIKEEISSNKLPASTKQMTSTPVPLDIKYTRSESTFYSSSTLCEVDTGPADTNRGSEIDITCAPLASYPIAAEEIEPLFNAYVLYRTEFADPEKSHIWLEFSPDESSYYSSYITTSQTVGYQIGMAQVDDLSSKDDPNGNKSGAAFFYAKNNIWYTVTDRQNAYAIPCGFTFPNQDSHQAYLGQNCMTADSDHETVD